MAGSVLARPIVPAEKRYEDYSGELPPCDDPGVLSRISDRFEQKESEYWSSSLQIVAYDRISSIGIRPWGLDHIPRTFCVARARLNDNSIHEVSYSIAEDLGIIGFGYGVEWCVEGSTATSPMRPIARWRALSGLAAAITAAALIYGRTARPRTAFDTALGRPDPASSTSACSRRRPRPRRTRPEPSERRLGPSRHAAPASATRSTSTFCSSWSPAFCQTPAAEHASTQCEPGARLGFVVHGLWPQNQHGYPSNCDSAAGVPSRMALAVGAWALS